MEGIENRLMSESIGKLAESLSKAQASIENVSKDKTAYAGNRSYKWADLATCLDAVKKPLSDNGLAVTQLLTHRNDEPILTTILLHSSGEWLKSELLIKSIVILNKDGKKVNNDLQAIGAGITYCRRYALAAVVGLTQEDDDAQSLTRTTNTTRREPLQLESPKLEPTPEGTELRKLCTENAIDPILFAKTFGITKDNIDAIKKAVTNFKMYKEEFQQRTEA